MSAAEPTSAAGAPAAAAEGAHLSSPLPTAGREGRTGYGTIVIVGGGCYGSYYLRQLTRAKDAGAISYDRLLVVDRDPGCRVARAAAGPAVSGAAAAPSAAAVAAAGGPPRDQDAPELAVARHHFDALRIEVAGWRDFFARYLDDACAEPGRRRNDAIVPSPLMPHLMFDWLLARARARWPGRHVHSAPLEREPSMPWQRAAPDGTHYVSFAEWMCPINCVEPALCPEIRGPRTWSMPPALRAYADAERARGRPVAGPVIFPCVHRAYGVGMFDVADAVAADAALAGADGPGAFRVLVGTVSHCHGALGVIEVGAERPPAA
ncbi:MAG: hypothetical protein ACJ79S_10935 [Gemmatimonadaceae bacterium]